MSATTVRKVLREERLGPAGKSPGPSWREFLCAQASRASAVDFFTVDTWDRGTVRSTVRSECLDWLLIVNIRHLERALTVFIDHYNACRPHRSLALAPPNGRPAIENWSSAQTMAVKRSDRLGGLLHEYERAA